MKNSNSGQPHPLVPFVLAACTAVSVLSTDLLAPSIPDLPQVFGVDIQTAQAVVGINLAAYALAHLVHGPLSDAIGRRRLLLSAFGLFACVSVFCAFAWSMEILLAGRFLQGLFSSVPSVVIVLIIRELYGPAASVRVMALYGFAIGAAPALGPLIGGYLHIWYGWSAGFWLSATLAIVVGLAFALLVPETLRERKLPRLGHAVGAYRQLLSRPAFLMPALSVGLGFAAYFAYVTTAPVVFRESFGLPTERFGLATMIIVAAFMMGSLAASRVARFLTGAQILRISFALLLFSMVVLAAPVLIGVEQLHLMIAAMTLYGFAFAGIMASGPIVVLDAVPDLPQGPASALFGALQLGLAAAAGLLSGQFFDGTAMSMVLVMLGFVGTGALLLILPLRGGEQNASEVIPFPGIDPAGPPRDPIAGTSTLPPGSIHVGQNAAPKVE